MVKEILQTLQRPYEEQIFEDGKPYEIVLMPTVAQRQSAVISRSIATINTPKLNTDYEIKVKKYMTQKSSSTFNFMQQWNNDVPMPFMEMRGKATKETKGMLYMELSGIYRDNSSHCMRCGRTLTNEVSRFYGLGPECGSHAYINPFNSSQELTDYVEENRQKIVHTTWCGWVVKSAIVEFEEC